MVFVKFPPPNKAVSSVASSRCVKNLSLASLVFATRYLLRSLSAGPKDDLKGPYGRSENVNVNATDSMLPPGPGKLM